MNEDNIISAEAIDIAEQNSACRLALEWLREQHRTWADLVEQRTGWAQWAYMEDLIPTEVADAWRGRFDPRRRLAVWKNGDPPLNLSGSYLAGANMVGVDLPMANLSGAYMSGADLARAKLKGANMQGAYLAFADLRGADLRGADLRNSYLQGANLEGADLKGACMSGATGLRT
jgi:hypothetical protein